MNLLMRMLYGLANIIPKGYANKLKTSIQYADTNRDWRFFGGIIVLLMFVVLLSSFIGTQIYEFSVSEEELLQFQEDELSPEEILEEINNIQIFKISSYILVSVLLFFLIPFVINTYFFLKMDKRSNEVEIVLPNALNLVAANLRAGMTPYQSIKMAAIPEFGVLGKEFERATSRSTGVKNFTDYLEEISQRVNSLTLQRTIRLLVASMKSGGKLAELLEGLSLDISERSSLKKELEVNIKTNMMFIMFIIIMGTPSLLSISIYFVETVSEIQEGTDLDSAQSADIGGFGGGELSISAVFLERISYVILFMTSLLASFFLGGVLDGDVKRGLRFAPYMVVGSFIVFIIARYTIDALL